MDAQIVKVVIVPAKLEDGAIIKNEYARLTIDVPLDGQGQRGAVLDLFGFLQSEYVALTVEANQLQLAQKETKIELRGFAA